MRFIDYMDKLETLKDMASHKRSGSPKKIAEKFKVSERTVQRMVEQLRDHGFPIVFERFRNSYVVDEK